MKIGILGASTMGRGLIQHCANCGFDIIYRARSQKSVDDAYAHVAGQYDFMISRGWLAPEKKEKTSQGSSELLISTYSERLIS